MSEARWRSVTVDEHGVGRRADVWLSARFVGWSRSAVARHIADGSVQSEVRPLKPATLLALGEPLRLFVPELAPEGPPPPMPPVLYEDDAILVLDKPAGMLVHPAGQRYVWAVIGLARDARPDDDLHLAHRLDRETSGVLVLAKHLAAATFLKTRVMFHEGMTKEYQAIVRGVVPWDRRLVDAPIGSAIDSEIRIRRGVNAAGRHARTHVTVLRRMPAHTLVGCRIEQGRTHQIRVHMEHVGFPLLGDKIYGQPDAVFIHHLDHPDDAIVRRAVGFPRHALHASRLVLPHPDGGSRDLEAPLPADLQAVVDGADPCWAE